ncbi:XVIPCD domain-containing protein [Lysobacter sp. Root494]|uniref:XVIPCD domain-containing protein n=1 Tax=Lysobacter sp. Root494 TaxID=1736549 RepID=UPI0009E9A43E|nr:XVIPCD domain-containing protein [Lysobacter sp. Root494]
MSARTSDADPNDAFADAIRGVDPQPMDSVLARINADTYEESGSLIDNWSPVAAEQLAAFKIRLSDLENSHTGFRARLYTDGNNHYVLAFRGSDEAEDWKHNIRQGAGLRDVQYEQAIDLARKTHRAFGNNVVLTGHSLGGGLATAGALATAAPAVTFNSAGLHTNTIEHLGFDTVAVRRELMGNGQIRHYSVTNEIVTSLQEHNLLTRGVMPDALGHRIELPDPHPVRGWKSLIPGSALMHGIAIHGMDSVIEAQQLAAHGSVANPAHPQHRLFNEALNGLKGINRETLGFRSEDEYRNAAGSLAVKAQQGGLHRIDHVVGGANGTLFAVEGPLESAGHRIVGIDKGQAVAQSIETSSQQLQSPAEAPAQPMQPERQRHAVALP